MTDITHPLARALSAHPRFRSNAIGRFTQTVARGAGGIARSIAAAHRARQTNAVLSRLSDAQRRDIGLAERTVGAGEPSLGDINRARGFAFGYQLGWPYGR